MEDGQSPQNQAKQFLNLFWKPGVPVDAQKIMQKIGISASPAPFQLPVKGCIYKESQGAKVEAFYGSQLSGDELNFVLGQLLGYYAQALLSNASDFGFVFKGCETARDVWAKDFSLCLLMPEVSGAETALQIAAKYGVSVPLAQERLNAGHAGSPDLNSVPIPPSWNASSLARRQGPSWQPSAANGFTPAPAAENLQGEAKQEPRAENEKEGEKKKKHPLRELIGSLVIVCGSLWATRKKLLSGSAAYDVHVAIASIITIAAALGYAYWLYRIVTKKDGKQ